jgi:hypothetical protein
VSGLIRLLLTWCVLALTAGVAVATAATAATPHLNLTLVGSVKGSSLHGKVQNGIVRCYPLSGKGLEVQWSGETRVGAKVVPVSGDIQFQKTGKSTFGPKGNAIASLVVNNDYSNRLGSALPGGRGNATLAANRKSGTISVKLIGVPANIQEQGSWACA